MLDVLKPGAVLSDRTIREMISRRELIENEVHDIQIQPNSVDLTLANTFKILKPNSEMRIGTARYPIIDPFEEIRYKSGVFSNESPYGEPKYDGPAYFRLDPGQFVLMASNEILNIPNGILSFVQGRSSVARLAIQTEQAGLIDAGFRGTITFEVFNQSEYPILLYENMRIAQVYFFRAEKADQVYGFEKHSKYSGQIEATGSKINIDLQR